MEPDVAKIAITFLNIWLGKERYYVEEKLETFKICYHCFRTWNNVQTDITQRSQTDWLAICLAGNKILAKVSSWNSQACNFESLPEDFQNLFVAAPIFQS